MIKQITTEALAKMIDHTLLKATATRADIARLCEEAKKYQFASVCVNPDWVPFAAQRLFKSGVKVCTVIGFPLGANSPSIKAKEAEHAVLQGADEVDMVINIAALKDGDLFTVEDDISGVVDSARSAAKICAKTVIVKVILETCYLSDDEKATVCALAKSTGADFVKTSTGFGTPGTDNNGNPLPSGATVHDIKLMRKTVDTCEPKSVGMLVKASGGIRDLKTALEMIEAGADRLGVSAGVAIIESLTQNPPPIIDSSY